MTSKRKPGRPRGGPGHSPRISVRVPAALVELVGLAANANAQDRAVWLRRTIGLAAIADASADEGHADELLKPLLEALVDCGDSALEGEALVRVGLIGGD